MPQVNTLLLVAVVLLVIGFGAFERAVGNAYGIAVTGVMLVTVMLLGVVMWRMWKWHPVPTLLVMMPFLIIDVGFFFANVARRSSRAAGCRRWSPWCWPR